MIRRRLFTYIAISFTAIILGFQNCGPGGFKANPVDGKGNFVAASSTTTVVTSKVLSDCQIVSPDILQSRLKNILGIAAGDVPVLADNGNTTNVMRIASNLTTLGKGDPSTGMADDYSCTTPKFKTMIQVFVDACAIALNDSSVAARLFPNGTGDLNALFTSLLGRGPTADEIAIIVELQGAVSPAQVKAATCGAVASSLASLIVI